MFRSRHLQQADFAAGSEGAITETGRLQCLVLAARPSIFPVRRSHHTTALSEVGFVTGRRHVIRALARPSFQSAEWRVSSRYQHLWEFPSLMS
jgi:hypothetical protein